MRVPFCVQLMMAAVLSTAQLRAVLFLYARLSSLYTIFGDTLNIALWPDQLSEAVATFSPDALLEHLGPAGKVAMLLLRDGSKKHKQDISGQLSAFSSYSQLNAPS